MLPGLIAVSLAFESGLNVEAENGSGGAEDSGWYLQIYIPRTSDLSAVEGKIMG